MLRFDWLSRCSVIVKQQQVHTDLRNCFERWLKWWRWLLLGRRQLNMACQMGWRAAQPHQPDQRCCPPSPGVKSHEQLSTMAAWRFLERPRGGKCSQTASDRGQPRGPSQRLSQVRVPSLSPRPCDTVCACRVRLTQAAPAASAANGQGARLYERAGPQRSGGSPHTGWHRRGVPLLNLVCNNNLNNSRSNRPHHHQ